LAYKVWHLSGLRLDDIANPAMAPLRREQSPDDQEAGQVRDHGGTIHLDRDLRCTDLRRFRMGDPDVNHSFTLLQSLDQDG